MYIKFYLFIAVLILIMLYYVYVLYVTLKYKRTYNKSADAADLTRRNRWLKLLFFRRYVEEEQETYTYKILKNKPDEDKKALK